MKNKVTKNRFHFMDDYVDCCESCYQLIKKRSRDAAELWPGLCFISMVKDKWFPISGEDIPELRVLELLGFIVTSEREDHLMVKVNGICQDEIGHYYFCIEDFYHD